MSTGEGVGGDARDDHAGADREPRRGDRIGVGGGDDSVTRIQLAARWAETYSPRGDSLGSVLRRFRAAYNYLDAVIHDVEPSDLDQELLDPRPGPQPVAAAPPPAPAYAAPQEAAPQSPPAPPEARPWG